MAENTKIEWTSIGGVAVMKKPTLKATRSGILQAMHDLATYEDAPDVYWIADTETMFDRLAHLFIMAGGNYKVLKSEFPDNF